MANKKIVIEDEKENEGSDISSEPASEAPASSASDDTSAVLKELEEKVAAAEAEARENHDRLLRMAAEFENFKKRSARDMEDTRKYAVDQLIGQLLTVVDNLERAIVSAGAGTSNDQGVVDGVLLTLAEVKKILEKHHVSPIESLGAPFDPAFHQAMSQEARDDQPPNTVVQEYQKGYLIHDRLLRPAMVVVSKAAPNGQSPDDSDDSIDTNA